MEKKKINIERSLMNLNISREDFFCVRSREHMRVEGESFVL